MVKIKIQPLLMERRWTYNCQWTNLRIRNFSTAGKSEKGGGIFIDSVQSIFN